MSALDDRDDRSAHRRPRVLIAGAGEPRHGDLCNALRERGIEPVVVEGALDEAIREERPNLVLLVGDAASDDGARGIDDARRAGPTPIVVATDPEPLDRRLAPFQYGASGIVVRRDDPDEMAGEIHHLLAENARRIAERARSGHTTSELDGLVGLGSRELRMSATPHEGVSRPAALALARGGEAPGAVPPWPPDDVGTVDRSPAREPAGGALPDWDEDATTQRQPNDDVARWRRISATDRSALPTPEVMTALDADGRPIESAGSHRSTALDAVTAETSLENVLARQERPTAERPVPDLALALERAIARSGAPPPPARPLLPPIDDEWDMPTAQHDDVRAKIEAVRAQEEARARSAGPSKRASLPEERAADAGASASLRSELSREAESAAAAAKLVSPPPRPRPLTPFASALAAEPAPRGATPKSEAAATPESSPVGPAALPRASPVPDASAPRTDSERISSSAALLAPAPPSRRPLEDRASTLRAQAMPRRRASVAPALVVLGLMVFVVGSLAVGRFVESGVAGEDTGAAAPPRALLEIASASPTIDAPGEAALAQPEAVGGAEVEAPEPVAEEADPVVEADPVAGAGAEPAVDADPVAGSGAEPIVDAEPVAGSGAEPIVDAEPVAEAVTGSEAGPEPLAGAADPPVADRARADELVRQARTAARSGDRAVARALLDDAFAADPNNPHALIALARHCLDVGETADAIRFAERAVALRRRRAEYHLVLGDARHRAGDSARAQDAWRTALELDPELSAARARLAP